MSPDEPEGPTGVWAEYADGQRYADLPTVFDGYEDGLAVFSVLWPRDEPPKSVGAKVFPGKTSLVIPGLAQ